MNDSQEIEVKQNKKFLSVKKTKEDENGMKKGKL